MINLILTKLLLAWDLTTMLTAFLIVRMAMVRSPLFNPAAPQWEETRYWAAGAFAAFAYVLLAWVSGFYSRKAHTRPSVIPIVNLLIFIFILILGFLACWRYNEITDGMQFISKRVLLFSTVISYILTTIAHYFTALYIVNKKSEGKL